jgi:tRNA(Arg) A34 adenosine deaminase TadA
MKVERNCGFLSFALVYILFCNVCNDCDIMEFSVSLPQWAIEAQKSLPEYLPNLEDRMRAVIEFSQKNIDHQTGGPFSAGVFERDSGRRIVIGVNRVVPCNVSSAHAEIVALSLAQQLLASWDLGGKELPPLQLVVNWRPCAMCYGATLWSGIRSLVIAGADDACERITGFDEGPIHPEWREELKRRGIELQEGVLYNEAVQVFENFRSAGHLVYNGRQG